MTRQPVESFLAWLERDAPSIHNSLGSPASAASLAAVVETCGDLPASFLELYRSHDGQVSEAIDFVPYYYLLTSKQIVAIWNDKRTYDDSWKAEWIPFARFDCDYLCLDAKTGRVIAFFLKFDRPVIANSFDEFLARMQASVQSGDFLVTADGFAQDVDADLAWTAMWERMSKPKKPAKKAAPKKAASKKTTR